MKYCNIDIETYSAADLKKTGVFVYAEHPSTEILVICWRVGEKRLRTWTSWEERDDLAHLAKVLANPGIELRAFNAQFERVMLNSEAGIALGLPNTPVSRWRCTAVQAALHALPRDLGSCASALGTHPKDDTGKKAMLKLSKPRSAGKLKGQPWLYPDCPEDFNTLANYCGEDVLAEAGIAHRLPRLPALEQQYYELDQKINERGVRVDIELAQWITETWTLRKEQLAARCEQLCGYKPSQVAGLRDWLAENGLELDNLRADTIRDVLAGSPLSDRVTGALKLRQEYSLTSVTKFAALQRASNQDGRLRGMFLYHGAQTGRWTGRIVQLQNLPRNTSAEPDKLIKRLYKGKEPLTGDVAQRLIRPVFHGDPGLLIGDYSSIELRFALWLADDQKAIKKIRKGVDMYKDLATHIYNKPLDQISKDERFVGKQAVLGLGYGMGAKKFVVYCQQQGQPITPDLADSTVSTYRKVYKKIYDTWWVLEGAAVEAIKNPGMKVSVCDGKVSYRVVGKFLYCILPSGRPISYPFPKVEMRPTPWGGETESITYMGVNQKTRQWERTDTFGGRLFENVCQGGSSCLLRHSMYLLDEQQFNIIMHVHDEVVCEDSEDRLEEFTRLMEVAPAWASGCPLSTEADFATRYRK